MSALESTPANNLTKIFTTVDENMTITMCTNGFLFDASGRDANEDYTAIKLVCTDIDQLFSLILEATKMERT